MSGSPALLGGVAHADPLAPLPIPAPPADVALLGSIVDPSPSPSPSPTSEQPSSTTAAPQDPAPAPAAPAEEQQPAPAPAPEPAAQQVAASSETAPEPVPGAPATSTGTTSAPTVAGPQPLRVGTVAVQPAAGQRPVSAADAPSIATPTQGAPNVAHPAALGGFPAGPPTVLSSGLLALPELPGLTAEHGPGGLLGLPRVQAPLVAPELPLGLSSGTSPLVVRTLRAAQNEPGKPVGTVLFVMLGAAGAAATARLRLVGWSRQA